MNAASSSTVISANAFSAMGAFEATSLALARQGVVGGPVGVLAGSDESGDSLAPLHLTRLGYECLYPDAAQQTALVDRAIALVRSGHQAEAFFALAAMADALAARGAHALVLGSAELAQGLAAGPLEAMPPLPIVASTGTALAA